MAENSKIEWCDHTFNPWEGCQKVGPGCDNCYAETRNARFGGGVAVNWGPGAPRRRTSATNWRKPVQWNNQGFYACANCGSRNAGRDGVDRDGAPTWMCSTCGSERLKQARPRVFCASLADVFDNDAPTEWRDDLWRLIETTPHLDWLLLTKRIGNVRHMVWPRWMQSGFPPNVWLGATVVNQEEAERDIPKLLAVPARVRFLSIEPMLGPICIECATDQADDGTIDWVIAGGESGPAARPVHPDWLRALRDECEAFGVPFIFKQFGEWRPPMEGEKFNTAMGRAQKVPAFIVAPEGTVHCFENERTASGGKAMLRVGKKLAGRCLDGLTHDGFPV